MADESMGVDATFEEDATNFDIMDVPGAQTEEAKKKRKPRRKRKNIDVKTLFVSGLPMDTKSREIYLMFRKYRGYQGSLLKMYGREGKTALPVAFVTFETRQQAEVAKSELQGIRFDEGLSKPLKIEFAKSNTKDAVNAMASTTPNSDSPQMNRPHTASFHSTSSSSAPVQHLTSHVAWPGMPTAPIMWNRSVQLTTTSPRISVVPTFHPQQQTAHSAFPQLTPAPPPIVKNNASSFVPNPEVVQQRECPPCTTLFVANLNHNATEEEVGAMFASLPHFRRVKMHHNNKGSKPVVFVQYSQLSSAIEAKTLFNGRTLMSTEGGGLRIEYAKKDMGEL